MMETRDSASLAAEGTHSNLKSLLEGLNVGVSSNAGKEDAAGPPSLPLADQIRLISAHIDTVRADIAKQVSSEEGGAESIASQISRALNLQDGFDQLSSQVDQIEADDRTEKLSALRSAVTRDIAAFTMAKESSKAEEQASRFAELFADAAEAIDDLEALLDSAYVEAVDLATASERAWETCAYIGIIKEGAYTADEQHEFGWLANAASSTPPAIRKLRERIVDIEKQVDETLLMSWMDAVDITNAGEGFASVTGKSFATVTYGDASEQIRVDELADTLQTRSLLAKLVKGIADDLLNNIARPLLEVRNDREPQTWTASVTDVTLFLQEGPDGAPYQTIVTVMAVLYHLKHYVFDALNVKDRFPNLQFEVARVVVPVLVPLCLAFMKRLLPTKLEKPIAEHATKTLTEQAGLAAQLIDALKSLGYLSGGLEAEIEPLSSFAESPGRHFLRALAMSTRARCRDLLLQEKSGGWEGVTIEVEVSVMPPMPVIHKADVPASIAAASSNKQDAEDDWGAWDEEEGDVKPAASSHSFTSPSSHARPLSPSITPTKAKQKKSALGGVRVIKPQDQLGSGPMPEEDEDWGWGLDEEASTPAATQSGNAVATSAAVDEDDWFAQELRVASPPPAIKAAPVRNAVKLARTSTMGSDRSATGSDKARTRSPPQRSGTTSPRPLRTGRMGARALHSPRGVISPPPMDSPSLADLLPLPSSSSQGHVDTSEPVVSHKNGGDVPLLDSMADVPSIDERSTRADGHTVGPSLVEEEAEVENAAPPDAKDFEADTESNRPHKIEKELETSDGAIGASSVEKDDETWGWNEGEEGIGEGKSSEVQKNGTSTTIDPLSLQIESDDASAVSVAAVEEVTPEATGSEQVVETWGWNEEENADPAESTNQSVAQQSLAKEDADVESHSRPIPTFDEGLVSSTGVADIQDAESQNAAEEPVHDGEQMWDWNDGEGEGEGHVLKGDVIASSFAQQAQPVKQSEPETHPHRIATNDSPPAPIIPTSSIQDDEPAWDWNDGDDEGEAEQDPAGNGQSDAIPSILPLQSHASEKDHTESQTHLITTFDDRLASGSGVAETPEMPTTAVMDVQDNEAISTATANLHDEEQAWDWNEGDEAGDGDAGKARSVEDDDGSLKHSQQAQAVLDAYPIHPIPTCDEQLAPGTTVAGVHDDEQAWDWNDGEDEIEAGTGTARHAQGDVVDTDLWEHPQALEAAEIETYDHPQPIPDAPPVPNANVIANIPHDDATGTDAGELENDGQAWDWNDGEAEVEADADAEDSVKNDAFIPNLSQQLQGAEVESGSHLISSLDDKLVSTVGVTSAHNVEAITRVVHVQDEELPDTGATHVQDDKQAWGWNEGQEEVEGEPSSQQNFAVNLDSAPKVETLPANPDDGTTGSPGRDILQSDGPVGEWHSQFDNTQEIERSLQADESNLLDYGNATTPPSVAASTTASGAIAEPEEEVPQSTPLHGFSAPDEAALLENQEEKGAEAWDWDADVDEEAGQSHAALQGAGQVPHSINLLRSSSTDAELATAASFTRSRQSFDWGAYSSSDSAPQTVKTLDQTSDEPEQPPHHYIQEEPIAHNVPEAREDNLAVAEENVEETWDLRQEEALDRNEVLSGSDGVTTSASVGKSSGSGDKLSDVPTEPWEELSMSNLQQQPGTTQTADRIVSEAGDSPIAASSRQAQEQQAVAPHEESMEDLFDELDHDDRRASRGEQVVDAWGWNDEEDEGATPVLSRGLRNDTMTSEVIAVGHVVEKPPTPIVAAELVPQMRKEKCLISQRSVNFVGLLHELMDDIQAISEEQGASHSAGLDVKYLIDTFNDILDLHRALMPIGHANTLNNVPTLAAQFFNDCTYIARELIRLDGRWKELAERHGTALLKDIHIDQQAQSTALLGQRSFDAQIMAQQAVLVECLTDTHSFEATYDEQRFRQCERAMRQIVIVMQQVSKAWKPVLTASNHLTACGRLIDSILQRVLHDMITLSDISEVEGEKLSELIRSLAELEDIFRDPLQKGEHSDVALHVPSWFKATYLSDILTGSLVDIEFLYFEAGALVDYTKAEVIGLIKALFSDSPKRTRLMERIQSAPE